MIFAIPLAWLQLKREKIRLLVAVAGISFAVILMFMQLGFRDALFNSAVRLHSSLQGDIFLISPKSTALIAMRNFSERRLYQALAYPGVESISSLYLDFGLWRNPDPKQRNTRSILVIGFDPSDSVFDLPDVIQNLDRIKLPDVVLFDKDSRAEFGPILSKFQADQKLGQKTTTEVSDRRIAVGGLFQLGASFGADGNIITSDLNFLRIFSRRSKGNIDVGLIKVEPGINVDQVLNQMREPTQPIDQSLIRPLQEWIERFGGPAAPAPQVCPINATPEQKKTWPRCLCQLVSSTSNNGPNSAAIANQTGILPRDVCALSKQEFVAFEKYYWQTSTSIGFIFTLGTAMGFIVGTIIVYQILYTDVTDHLPEYATLKAMGYRNRYLLSVVFQEALILAVLGFIPGVSIATFLYGRTQSATNLPLFMEPRRAIVVLGLTILMCCISGAISVRKAQSADPADIF